MPAKKRALLLRLTKYLVSISLVGILIVLTDYAIDIRPSSVHASYHFSLDSSNMPVDQPIWLRQDNLSILLIKRSNQLINQLRESAAHLQDRNSDSSRQPPDARNILRSRHKTYFVSYAMGTDFACPLELQDAQLLKETCGVAQYDFAGRALAGENQFQNLAIPDYTFNADFSFLTITP
ncbi:MAG: hypothetical protein ACI9JR_003084 [Gammaproteobacteria bacterium]|jgi:hypothetical protein